MMLLALLSLAKLVKVLNKNSFVLCLKLFEERTHQSRFDRERVRCTGEEGGVKEDNLYPSASDGETVCNYFANLLVQDSLG